MTDVLPGRGSGRGLSPAQEAHAVQAEGLAIAGLVPLSTVDWPGMLVATVFCQGCPWRCTYCHNRAILDPTTPGAVPFGELTALLERRRGLLDGVVLSGGEATGQHAIVPAARRIREMGFAVGLHTGGAYPGRLRALLGVDRSGRRVSAPLVDWVGFDVKAAPSGYEALTGRPGAYEKARASLGLLLASGVDHELRMTVTPALRDQVPSAIDLVDELGGRALVLQRARPDGTETQFAAALEAEADWHGLFADVVEAASGHGDMRGVEVAARS